MFALFAALAIAVAPAPVAAPNALKDHAQHQGMNHEGMKHDGPCCPKDGKPMDCCKDKMMPCCKQDGEAKQAPAAAPAHEHDH